MTATLALLPWLLVSAVLVLGALKIGVVLSVLRSGLGGDLPPAPVVAVLALLLSAVGTGPVAARCYAAMAGSTADPATALAAGAEPLRTFLHDHTPERERLAVLDLARRAYPTPPHAASGSGSSAPSASPGAAAAGAGGGAGSAHSGAAAAAEGVGARDLAVLAPAFALAELRLAFQIGFLLLLPFLVLDLLVSSLLAGLSLPGLSARAVALPFKLLLFVLCDGWRLLAQGLVPGHG